MNLDFISTWFNVLVKPKETFEKEKVNSSYYEGLKNFAIGLIIYAFLSAFFTAFFSTQSVHSGFSLQSIVNELILAVLFLIPFLLVYYVIFYILNAICNGSATFKEIFYLSSLFFAPFIILNAVMNYALGFFSLNIFYYMGYSGYGLGLATLFFIMWSIYLTSKIIFSVFESKMKNNIIKAITEIIVFVISIFAVIFIVLNLLTVILFIPLKQDYSSFQEIKYSGQLKDKNIEIFYGKGVMFTGWGYSYEFANDGTLIFKTNESRFEQKTEQFKMDREKLENLAFQIQHLDFFTLKDDYDCRKDPSIKTSCFTDSQSVTIRLTIGDKTKSVYEYDNSGPIELRHIENLIKDWNN